MLITSISEIGSITNTNKNYESHIYEKVNMINEMLQKKNKKTKKNNKKQKN